MMSVSFAFVWVLVALVGVVVEGVLAGSFVGIFCAIGAASTALLNSIGLLPQIWQQCCCFAGVTLLTVALARTPLLRWAESKNKSHSFDAVIGKRARVTIAMAPHAAGEVSLHGAMWRAINVSDVTLAKDASCRVQRMDGLVAYVEHVVDPERSAP